MSSLSLLTLLSVFAPIFLSVAVAYSVETRAWDAFSISPSGDDGLENLSPVAAKIWAQNPDIIDNSLAKPVDESDPSNCSGERTNDLREKQARPGMCQNNYPMDRKAGQSPDKKNPTVAKPVDAADMLFPDPLSSPTDEDSVCAKAPESGSHPVCAWIEWMAEHVVSSSFDLDFCRPYLLYVPCALPEHLWCCAEVLSKSPAQAAERHLHPMYAYAGYSCVLWDDTMSEHRGTFSHWP